jgi:hypothetical protein
MHEDRTDEDKLTNTGSHSTPGELQRAFDVGFRIELTLLFLAYMMNSRGEVDHGIHVSDGIPPVGVASNGFDQNVIPPWRGALGSPHNPSIALKQRGKMPTDEAVRARNKNPWLTVYHKMVSMLNPA